MPACGRQAGQVKNSLIRLNSIFKDNYNNALIPMEIQILAVIKQTDKSIPCYSVSTILNGEKNSAEV